MPMAMTRRAIPTEMTAANVPRRMARGGTFARARPAFHLGSAVRSRGIARSRDSDPGSRLQGKATMNLARGTMKRWIAFHVALGMSAWSFGASAQTGPAQDSGWQTATSITAVTAMATVAIMPRIFYADPETTVG